jgi:hypothetical protein
MKPNRLYGRPDTAADIDVVELRSARAKAILI